MHRKSNEIYTWIKRNAEKLHLEKIVFVAMLVGLLVLGISWLPQNSSSTLQSNTASTSRIAESLVHFARLVGGNDIKLSGEEKKRINILITGIGGEGHEGTQLTDAIMFASVDLEAKSIFGVSIPRDMLVPTHGSRAPGQWQKINAINAYEERANEISLRRGNPSSTDGAYATARWFEKTFAIPIDYYLRFDFTFFTRLIDDMGGIWVDVPNAFTDRLYPTQNFGYKTISFVQGPQLMDGETALMYVRSRHGNNGEGSDFARLKRQQLVISATLARLQSFSALASPKFITSTWENVAKHITTNLTIPEILRFAGIAVSWPRDGVQFLTLDDSRGNFLTATVASDGAAVLVPDIGSVKDISRLLLFLPELSKARLEQEEYPTEILIINGTLQTGLAQYAADQMTELGFKAEIAQGKGIIPEGIWINPMYTTEMRKNFWKHWWNVSEITTIDAISTRQNTKKSLNEYGVILVLGMQHAEDYRRILNNTSRYVRSWQEAQDARMERNNELNEQVLSNTTQNFIN